MKFTATYTLKEEFEAETIQEAREYIGMRLSQLTDSEYPDTDLEAEIDVTDSSFDILSLAF